MPSKREIAKSSSARIESSTPSAKASAAARPSSVRRVDAHMAPPVRDASETVSMLSTGKRRLHHSSGSMAKQLANSRLRTGCHGRGREGHLDVRRQLSCSQQKPTRLSMNNRVQRPRSTCRSFRPMRRRPNAHTVSCSSRCSTLVGRERTPSMPSISKPRAEARASRTKLLSGALATPRRWYSARMAR